MPKVQQKTLAEQLDAHDIKPPGKKKGPLWKGPEEDGITFSLLSRFIVCRERFRLLVVEGLRPADRFNHRLEFGSMWHVCEESFANSHGAIEWQRCLQLYAQRLCHRYPTQQAEIDKWYEICKRQFPLYVKYWANHPDVQQRTPLLSEEVFNIPYRLPSGRSVRLRGKFDSVDLVTNGKQTEVWLQENKSKGEIDAEAIQRQLTYDLQTMIYLVALERFDWKKFDPKMSNNLLKAWRKTQIAGVRYNVIRRPLSGGKGTIVRGKATQGSKCPKCKGSKQQYGRFVCPKCKGAGRINARPEESLSAYYDRVADYIKESPQDYFMRWNVYVSNADVNKFRRECLDPILEQLCVWWDYVTTGSCNAEDAAKSIHWRLPYGVYNPLLEGNQSDLDWYLATGRTDGLETVGELFPELKEAT